MRFHVSRPLRSERNIAMKSVPPEVAFHLRHSDIAKPNTIPPKMDVTKGSVLSRVRSAAGMNDVIASTGMRSVNRPAMKITYSDCSVKRLPMYLKPIHTGTALRARLIGANGTVAFHPNTPHRSCAQRWMRIERPVAPPGYSLPHSTKVR